MKRCSCKKLKARLPEEEAQGEPTQRTATLRQNLIAASHSWCPKPHGSLVAVISFATSAKLPERTGMRIAAGGGLGAAGRAPTNPWSICRPVGKLWSGQSCSELRDYLCASPISGCLLVRNFQFPNVRVHKQPDQYRGYDGPRSLRSDTTNPTAKFWQYRCPAPNCDIIRSYARTSRLSSPFQKFNSFSKGLNLFPRSEHLSSLRTKTLS